MPRPHRPNLNPDAPKGSKERKAGHVKQETATERKERKREEAELRNALSPENARARWRRKRR